MQQAAVSIRIGFDDGIRLGALIVAQLRAAALPADDQAALRRVYDALACAGIRDWSHDGIPRHD